MKPTDPHNTTTNTPIHNISALVTNAEYVSREKLLRHGQIVAIMDVLIFLFLAGVSRAPYLCLIAPYPLLTVIGLRKRRESYLKCCVGYHLASIFLRITLIILSSHNVGFILWGILSLAVNCLALYYNYTIAKQMVDGHSVVEMVPTYP